MKPGFGKGGPVRDGQLGGTKSEAVTAFSKDMKFGGNLCVFESLEVDDGAFDVSGVVIFGLQEEGGRNLRRRLE